MSTYSSGPSAPGYDAGVQGKGISGTPRLRCRSVCLPQFPRLGSLRGESSAACRHPGWVICAGHPQASCVKDMHAVGDLPGPQEQGWASADLWPQPRARHVLGARHTHVWM